MTGAGLYNRESLQAVCTEPGERARHEGRRVELSLYGGGALPLVFNIDRTTQDVDAVFEKDKTWVRRVAAEIARERDWPETWLNDGVKGFFECP